MVLENLLRHSQGHNSSNWKTLEAAIWARSIQRSVVLVMIVGSGFRLASQLLAQTETRDAVTIVLAALTFLFSLYIVHQGVQEGKMKRGTVAVFLTVTQAYCLYIGAVVYRKHFLLWCMGSTLVFCLYEIPAFWDWRVVLPLLLRQLAMWQAVSVYVERGSFSLDLPYLMLVGMAAVLLCFTCESRKKTVEKYKFCDTIEEEKAKLRNILQAIPEGLAVILESMEAPCANGKLQSFFKNSNSSIIEALNCLTCSETGTLLEQIKDFLSNSEELMKTFGVTQNCERYYEWKGTKCRWGDQVACILTVSEITSWITAKTRLEQESESKSALLRFVSHELRTPTNAILNLVSTVMQASNISPEQKTDLSIVVTSTHFLLSVINDLLDFSRMAAEKFSLVKQSFDVRKELSETVQLVELLCIQKGLFLKLKVDDFAPRRIYTDPNRLKQILLNLLGNALKFTFQGGIRLICMMTDRNTLKFTVKDTGIGIPPSQITNLCKAFSTVAGTQHINPQGCGLGLYISNLLAQCLGSIPIRISSTEHVGSEFCFEVSIYEETGAVSEGLVDATTAGIEDERCSEAFLIFSPLIGGKGSLALTLPEVLIVDDSEFNRLVLQRMLESFNIRVDQVSSGLRAISAVREGAHRGHLYRLILMDVEMPEMDGITAAQEIRVMESTGELSEGPVIIACSAHRGSEENERCLQAGMNGYIEKPISLSKLQEIVRFLPHS